MFTKNEIAALSADFETKTPQEIIQWAVDIFAPQIALSTSFQTQSMPLLYMVTRIQPDIKVFFLDTGYHFWDTLIFREQIQHEWNLNVIDLYRDSRWDGFVRQNTRTLPIQDPNLCCYIHKVQPMQKALSGLQAWISGIRRDQTPERAHAQVLELQDDGLLKVNPLLKWTKSDVQAYIAEHHLPAHPLYERGYRSVGCAPCTVAIGINDDERAGRWAGRGKIECGLHTDMFKHKDLA
ncbi:MAG TPA: phosphoadenylyl-sulfate reductase, partial [Anaerolineales bacterium]|nr:phosphoadenylyl-sulfate reductase [Anaerolineales bacterium]